VPGANGIKLHHECVFVSVTDWNTLFRIPVLKDGSPGELGLVADNLRADDFVFGASGAMYISRIPRILS